MDCDGLGQVRRARLLQVRVPAGVDDGSRIRLAGEGDAGARGGPRGDLYIFVAVKPHDLFERDGLDLRCQIPVPMGTAALGGEIDAPCLLGGEHCDGNCKLSIKIPAGTQTGHSVPVRGKGMPSLRSRQRGDLVVELLVETPTNLTARQKQLLKEFSGMCGESQSPRAAASNKKARRFWEKVTGAEDHA
jgi:molecular chaperone DnaJ